MTTPAESAFHAHLTKCAHCADNPFTLCVIGNALLKVSARAIIEENTPSEPGTYARQWEESKPYRPLRFGVIGGRKKK
jgi:hypothetical protein